MPEKVSSVTFVGTVRITALVTASALCLASVVCAGSLGHAQPLSCGGSLGYAQPLSCDDLSDCKQLKEKAHADAKAELDKMTKKEACLKGLRDAFEGDPPELPSGAADNFAACIDNGAKPTLGDAKHTLKVLQSLIRQKRDEVGNLLLEYEELKQRYEDGCA